MGLGFSARVCSLLLLQILICSTFLPSSDASVSTTAPFDGTLYFPTQSSSRNVYSGLVGGWSSWRRSSAEAAPASVDSPQIVENKSFVLAAERTRRKDPLDGYNYYTGGWNISEKHYLASVGFTAAPFFVIAVAWFVGFGLVLFLICYCYCCCPRRSYSYSRFAYALSLILLIIFTIAAIVGSVFLYYGQEKFHDSTSQTLDFVVEKADYTVENLQNFSSSLEGAQNIRVRQVSLPDDARNSIDALQTKISVSANELDVRTRDNSKKIRHVLNIVRLVLIVVAAVMLLLAFLGFFFSVLGLQFFVSILVIIGWILVAGTFILCGVFLLLHNAVADSCVAMDEWVQHPSEHTALDDVLPCVDVDTANESFNQSRKIAFDLISNINLVILNVANKNYLPNAVPLYYNQSGPLAPLLCNPYMADLSKRVCADGEVKFEDAPKAWRRYVCQAVGAPGSETCTSFGRFTPDLYNQLLTATSASFGLLNYGPFLKNLADCSFVREAFMTISSDKCPDLRHNSYWVYTGLGLVSAAVMSSLIFWVLYARERRHRKYGKQFLAD